MHFTTFVLGIVTKAMAAYHATVKGVTIATAIFKAISGNLVGLAAGVVAAVSTFAILSKLIPDVEESKEIGNLRGRLDELSKLKFGETRPYGVTAQEQSERKRGVPYEFEKPPRFGMQRGGFGLVSEPTLVGEAGKEFVVAIPEKDLRRPAETNPLSSLMQHTLLSDATSVIRKFVRNISDATRLKAETQYTPLSDATRLKAETQYTPLSDATRLKAETQYTPLSDTTSVIQKFVGNISDTTSVIQKFVRNISDATSVIQKFVRNISDATRLKAEDVKSVRRVPPISSAELEKRFPVKTAPARPEGHDEERVASAKTIRLLENISELLMEIKDNTFSTARTMKREELPSLFT